MGIFDKKKPPPVPAPKPTTKTDRAVRRAFARLVESADVARQNVHLFTETIMANLADVEAKVAELKDAVAADEAADAEVVARLNAKIIELQAAVDANTPVDTQPLIDELQSIRDSLQPAE